MKLRYYQADAVKATMKFFQRDKGKHGIIALPTGSGKSLVIAEIIRLVQLRWKAKVLVISHVQEILSQNKEEIEKHTGLKVGVNSSSIGTREITDVMVAGIQSIYRNPEAFEDFNLVIIDEVHRVSMEANTMYSRFLKQIGRHVVVGLTATPFRLGDGYIYGPGKMFDKLIYDCTSSDSFNKLVEEGYLCNLTAKRTKMEMDVSGIKLQAGDYNEKQLADKFDRTAITNAAVKEILAAGANRKAWLIFAIDISHAEHIAEVLLQNGIPTAPVHSKMGDYGFDREKVINDFKSGKYRCVINVNVLTTGFNHPGIDLIAVLRPTQSPVLHVQILGRGSRVSPGKDNCLVLDFAGNVSRLGAINDVLVKVKGKSEGGGEPVMKACPKCDLLVYPAIKICPECSHEFKFEHHLQSADVVKVIEDGKDHWIEVDRVTYTKHSNYGSPSSVKVSYHYGNKSISEYVCVEHAGFAKHKADHWIKYRGGKPCASADELIGIVDSLSIPSEILIQKRGSYFVIKDSAFIIKEPI